jgi:hypothetical protein
MPRMVRGIAIFLTFAAAPSAVAEGMRYGLFHEPDVGGSASYRAANAFVVDKKENQFWVLGALQLSRPHREQWCVRQARRDGRRPSLNEKYVAHVVTGSAMINPFLPVLWFIDPDSGELQFCDIRHAGLCVKIGLP